MQHFNKTQRLLKPSDYSYVFEKAFRLKNQAFTVLARESLSSQPRLGLAIAKKQVARATDRNLIKRIIRESFRLNANHLPTYDFVFMVRREIASMEREKISLSVQHIWEKTRKLCAR